MIHLELHLWSQQRWAFPFSWLGVGWLSLLLWGPKAKQFTGCEVMVITFTKGEGEADESFLSELEEQKVEMIIL